MSIGVRFLFVALLLVGVGCDPSLGERSAPHTGGVCGTVPDPGQVIADIDGVNYEGEMSTAVNTGGVINIASENCVGTVAVNFGTTAALGTVTAAQGATAQIETSDALGLTGVWIANDFQGSATITVTALSEFDVEGTFSFSAPASGSGATGTKVLTGSFKTRYLSTP